MSRKGSFWFFMGLVTMILAMSCETHAQEGRREERREGYPQEKRKDQREDREHLVGRWYKDGAPCEIVYTREGFEARNETGSTSVTSHK